VLLLAASTVGTTEWGRNPANQPRPQLPPQVQRLLQLDRKSLTPQKAPFESNCSGGWQCTEPGRTAKPAGHLLCRRPENGRIALEQNDNIS